MDASILQLSLDNLLDNDYLTSILLAEIAFESFVDWFLYYGYSEKGLLNEDEISALLIKETVPVKVNRLMNNIYQTKLSRMKDWEGWEKKVLIWRNQIAHGAKVSFSINEAKYAYDLIVDAIFFFIEKIDDYFKKVGEPNGLFYRT